MTLELNLQQLQKTLDISIEISKTMGGCEDPNFKRIHHHNHHIVLYIKDYVMKEKCKNYFEIGTHYGHSVCNILQSRYKSKIVTCDLFLKGHSIAPDCKIKDVEMLARQNVSRFNKNNHDCVILRGNSYSDNMFNRVVQQFPDGIDLLFIDGDHKRFGVTSDFEKYFPLVNPGGYIVFDDYLPYEWKGIKRECPVAINDLVNKYKNHLEVIGLIDDLVGCNKLKNLNESKNCDFIVRKKI